MSGSGVIHEGVPQRLQALERANSVRAARAQLRRGLKAGTVTIEELYEDPNAQTMPVLEAVSCLPYQFRDGVPVYANGKRVNRSTQSARKLLVRAGVPEYKQIGELTPRWRKRLALAISRSQLRAEGMIRYLLECLLVALFLIGYVAIFVVFFVGGLTEAAAVLAGWFLVGVGLTVVIVRQPVLRAGAGDPLMEDRPQKVERGPLPCVRKNRHAAGGGSRDPSVDGRDPECRCNRAPVSDLSSQLRLTRARLAAVSKQDRNRRSRAVDAQPTAGPDSDPGSERSDRVTVTRRIHQLLAEMEMVSRRPPSALDDVFVSSGKAGTRAPTTAGDRLIDEWAKMFARLCFAGERALKHYKGMEKSYKLLSREERSDRILAYPNDVNPTFVAFIEGVTESHVRQLRAKARADARREKEPAA